MSKFIWKKNQTRRIHNNHTSWSFVWVEFTQKIEMRCFRVVFTKKKCFCVVWKLATLYDGKRGVKMMKDGLTIYRGRKKNPKFYVMNAKTYDANTTTIFDWLCKI